MDLSTSAGQFSDELTKLLIPPSHTGNALVSPLSLLTALSMLLVASKGPTREKLASALKLPSNFSQEEVDSYYNTLITAHKSQADDGNKLLIRNKMLVSEASPPLLPSFEGTLRVKYDASVEKVDFINKRVEVKNKVNSWVNESTNGLIKSILDEPPRAGIVLILLNAVYFESKWVHQFYDDFTSKFYVDGLTEKNATFMECTTSLKYSELDGPNGTKVQALSIPYRSGHSMVILLPPKNVSVNSLFEQKKIFSMARQVTSLGEKWMITLKMPKFKFDTKLSMKSHLSSMGAGDLFTSPDLSGINGESNLTVCDVTHATAIEVDTEGTKAAAVSDLGLFDEIFIKVKRVLIVLDRPFAFVIYDTTRNLPIFVGKMSDPPSPQG